MLLVVVLIVGTVAGVRMYHIFMTSTGRQAPDVPDVVSYPVRGVDVSYYQGNINWSTLVSQDIDFAFMKATEGIDYSDSQFAQNWESAAGENIYVGAYHFFRFEDDGAAQAENFIRTVPVTENTLPPVIDVELYDTASAAPAVAETRDNLQKMLDALEAHYGVKPIIYAAPNTYRTYVSFFAGEYPIWMSNYYYKPYSNWAFWQYTDSGLLEGYDGDQVHIDLNVYRGSHAEFLEQFGLHAFES